MHTDKETGSKWRAEGASGGKVVLRKVQCREPDMRLEVAVSPRAKPSNKLQIEAESPIGTHPIAG